MLDFVCEGPSSVPTYPPMKTRVWLDCPLKSRPALPHPHDLCAQKVYSPFNLFLRSQGNGKWGGGTCDAPDVVESLPREQTKRMNGVCRSQQLGGCRGGGCNGSGQV